MSLPLFVDLIAIAALILVLQDAFEVMLLPRRVQRRRRLTGLYFSLAWAAWKRLAVLLPAGRSRENVLSHFGALSMIGLFGIWTVMLIVLFGVLEWSAKPASAASAGSTLSEQIYMSGVTFFTLGYGDVVPRSGAARFISVLEAGTGLGLIAVVIGYLPVLYQLFARREAHVIQLDGRAGSPPTETAMLCRHAEADGMDRLNELLREWEVWGAELLESHLSYPMLAYYRSQHDNQSWLAAVTAVMDCCALILIGVKELAPLQARMTFTMARQVVVEMARSFQVAPSSYDGGDRLPDDAYIQMEAAFAASGVAWEGGADAEVALHALRATYEPLLDGLARHLLLALPGWIPQEDAADHWIRGHRGTLARRIVERLAGRSILLKGVETEEQAKIWRNIRSRFRV